MVKEITFEDTIEVTELFIGEMLKEFKVNWADDENAFTMATGNKVTLEDISEKNPGDKVKTRIKGAEFLKKFEELEAKQKELTKHLVTKEKVKGTALKNCFDYEYDLNGIIKHGKIFKHINSRLTKTGITNVLFNKQISQDNIADTDVTLYINPSFSSHTKPFKSGEMTRLREVLYSKLKDKDATSSDEINFVTGQSAYSLVFEEEDVKEIKLLGKVVGRYYKERNQIHMYMNPFGAKKVTPLDENAPELLELFLSSIELLKVKKCNKDKFVNTLFVRLFLKKATEEAIRMESVIKNNEKTIIDYEKSILRMIQDNNSYNDQIAFLNRDSKTKGAQLVKSIGEVKTLPFIKSVDIDGININLTFKATNLKIPFLKLNGNKFGKAKFFLGEIMIQVKPDGFLIHNKTFVSNCFNGHPHPHASGNPGSPCMGDGDGRKKIMELLHQCKFVDLARMLWIWIKTFRPDGAYYHENEVFRYCVGHGIPIWDENDKPITIKVAKDKYEYEVYKESDNDSNVKKYKDIKP